MLPLFDTQVRLVLLNHVAVRLAEANPDELHAAGIENEQLARLRQLSALDLNRLATMRDLNIGESFDAAGLTAGLRTVSLVNEVKALEASEVSSQLALDANKLGYQVGVRINIDVLNSQSQLFQTKRDLAQARYNVLLGGLKLRQANGSLKAEDLQAVNALLQR